MMLGDVSYHMKGCRDYIVDTFTGMMSGSVSTDLSAATTLGEYLM